MVVITLMEELSELLRVYAEKISENKAPLGFNMRSLAKSLENYDETVAGGLQSLVKQISGAYEDQMNKFREILLKRSDQYDILLARLQYLEEKNNVEAIEKNKKVTSANRSSDSADEEDSGKPLLDSDSSNEFGEIFEFDHKDTTEIETNLAGFSAIEDEADSKLKISESSELSIPESDADIASLAALKAEVEQLKDQNKQYLALGLQWKEKYKLVIKEKLSMAQNHCEDVKKLYQMAEAIPVKNSH